MKDVKRNSNRRGTNKKSPRRNAKPSVKEKPTYVKDESNDSSATDPRFKNDPSWYFSDPVMKTGLMRMPTMEFLGRDIDLESNVISIEAVAGDDRYPGTYNQDAEIKSPTLVTYYMNPSPGYTNTDSPVTSAINQASRKLYAKLSASNAKTSQYAPQDITTLILQLGEIISIVNYLTRCYGVGTFFNRFNRAVPYVFLKAFGYTDDVGEWSKLMPEFRARLNKLITIANSITFPSNIPYFSKCAYLYQNIFLDSTDEMSAMHMLSPYSTWKIDETYTEGTALKTVLFARTAHYTDPFEVMDILEDMINEVLTSLTYNYIYADIINLANRGVLGNTMLHFDTIPVDYAITPIYSDQFCWQMMNATFVGEPGRSGERTGYTPSNDVIPDVNNNCIKYRPEFSFWMYNDSDYMPHFNEPIIRVPSVDVSEDDLLELSVYTTAPDVVIEYSRDEDTGDDQWHCYEEYNNCDLPDHYVVQARLYNGNNHQKSFSCNNLMSRLADYGDAIFASLALSGEVKHFPLMYSGRIDSNSSYETHVLEYTNTGIFGGLGNYTRGIKKAFANIRYASYLNLFSIE